ncbi:MAG: NYN domain-containing protein [Dermatophilaceae bacterium]
MLRASVVIDYQNLHLTARDVFAPSQDPHVALIHPVRFAQQAIEQRNDIQRDGHPHAELSTVSVYRGLPHVDYDTAQNRRCTDQARRWRADGARVELRDLKYRHRRDSDGRRVVDGPGREKGIDVLVALACVREARRPDIDLVILASRDSDLVPVLDEVTDLWRASPQSVARIETVSWREKGAANFGSLRATPPRRIWDTNLGRRRFEASLDPNDYA